MEWSGRAPAPPERDAGTGWKDGVPPPRGRMWNPTDGGLELPGKVVQELVGHSSITMTMDTYDHLFPRGDDAAELAAAERLLLG